MSINSLTNAAAARRLDTVPIGKVPQGFEGVARAAATVPSTSPPAPAGGAAAPQQTSAADTALNVLFGYIPTEVLTLYVAVLAVLAKPNPTGKVITTPWSAFWFFLIITPIVVWLVYAAKIKALQKPLPVKVGMWPVWEMSAATVAYWAWAQALPNSPFTELYSQGLSCVIVLVTSAALGLLAPLFQRPLS
jgi:hypothetical protein